MKALKLIKYLFLSIGLFMMIMISSGVVAQEYDDMYFNKSDRKTVKVDKGAVLPDNNRNYSSSNYKKITESTETYSAKNVNPEYIARYKSSEANQSDEPPVQKNDSYSSEDYFVEGYDDNEYTENANRGEIDYAALNRRDQMSSSNFNRSFSNPSWRFNPYMGMGFGYPYYGGFGYDPFMMGSGFNVGFGFGSGFGYSPFTAYSIGMSWGTGYNPWWGWGGYPGFYDPFGGWFYDPWDPMFGFSAFNRFGYSPYSRWGYRYGAFRPTVVVVSNGNGELNGRSIQYKPRTTRSSTIQRSVTRGTSENVRISSSDANIRVPNRDVSRSASNGRINRDYSKVQNEYYNRARRSTSSTQRISSNNNRQKTFSRSSSASSRYSSSINSNKPVRSNNSYSSGYNRSSNRSSSYSGFNNSNRRSSSSSFSTPSRSSSSYSRSSFSSGSSGSRSSSFSSGGSRSSSSGSRSSSYSSRGGGRRQ